VEECKVTYVEPSSKHPCAMLFNLKSFDVDVRDDEADKNTDSYKAHPGLDVEAATECSSSDHQSANQANTVKQKCCVSHNTMDDNPAMADEGSELEDCEDACRKYAAEVEHDSDLIAVEVDVVVALSWRGAVPTCRSTLGAEVVAEVDVHEAGKTEAKKCASKNKP
jgi:hypothetical protein